MAGGRDAMNGADSGARIRRTRGGGRIPRVPQVHVLPGPTEWRLLDSERKKKQKAEFASLLHVSRRHHPLVLLASRIGPTWISWSGRSTRTSRRYGKWPVESSSTELGHYLETTYAYLAASKRVQYTGGTPTKVRERSRMKSEPHGSATSSSIRS